MAAEASAAVAAKTVEDPSEAPVQVAMVGLYVVAGDEQAELSAIAAAAVESAGAAVVEVAWVEVEEEMSMPEEHLRYLTVTQM